MGERFVLLELVGGPRHGQVLGWEFPAAATIVFPIVGPAIFVPDTASLPTHPLRAGHYRRRTKQPGHDVVTLDIQTDPRDVRGITELMKRQGTRPLVYHWEGEYDY